MSNQPRCQQCAGLMPALARSHAKFCSGRCRVAAHRQRQVNPNLPAELTRRARWVNNSWAKVPFQPSGKAASVSDPSTWSTYRQVAASERKGFVLNGDGIVCIDLDHCLVDGCPTPEVARILSSLPPTYVEVSPSGTGLHIWGRGSVERGRRTAVAEVYGTGRYITVTGRAFNDAPKVLADISRTVESLLA